MKEVIEAKDLLTRAIKLPDAEIEVLAKTYLDSAKLRSRISFIEFCDNPDAYLENYEQWPDTIWLVKFVHFGSHRKMWVNDKATGKTLGYRVIRKDKASDVLNVLRLAAAANGNPDTIRIEPDHAMRECQMHVVDWCYDHDVFWHIESGLNRLHKAVA